MIRFRYLASFLMFILALGISGYLVSANQPQAVESAATGPLDPLAAAAADFNEDGATDVIGAYRHDAGGTLLLFRGSGDSQADPFVQEPARIALPVPADFIAAGDFSADGHADVVVASRGHNQLFVVTGDGRGNFSEPRVIDLPGSVTAFASQRAGIRDSDSRIAVGVMT